MRQARRARSTRRRISTWTAKLVVGAVAIGGIAWALPLDGTGAQTPLGEPARPSVPTRLHIEALSASTDSGRTFRLAQHTTAEFSMVGVTWDDARAELPGTVEVRTHAEAGDWSRWLSLDATDADLPDGDDGTGPTRGGTAPLWVGSSDGIEVRVNGRPARTLPAGLRVDLIDPGQSRSTRKQRSAGLSMAPAAFVVPDDEQPDPATPTATGSAQPTATANPTDPAEPPTTPAPPPSATASATPSATTPAPTATRPTPPTSSVPAPKIVTRAGWEADEGLREAGDPDYATAAKVVFVHHSDTAVDYECSESAGIIRGMYTYHVKSKGWRDLAYNFVVDKCGTLFEGRFGGVDLPVIGSHTYGFNTNSTGVVVIGNYEKAPASDAAVATVARLATWKLSLAGVSPSSTSSLVYGVPSGEGRVQGQSYPFEAISAHQDARATDCPGTMLYAQLPKIRALATAAEEPTLFGFGGATQSGRTWYTPGPVTVNWKSATPALLVSRHEVLVDGTVAASVPAGTASAKITLKAGSHTLAVRTVHLRGDGATSASATVVADTTLPRFTTAPNLALRTGTVTTTAVPLTVGWKATDDTVLSQLLALAPTKATFGPTVQSWKTAAKPGSSRTTFTISAVDAAGNHRDASAAARTTLTKETAAKRTGTWTTKKNAKHLNGSALATTAKNASLSWKFTGTSVAWIAARTTTSGQAAVYLDGKKVATLDLKAATAFRQAVWTAGALSSGSHTLKVVALGTKGRPTVYSDGIAVLAP